MTFPEYLYRMKAFNLAQVDKHYDMHLSAWLQRKVELTEQKGDKTYYVYKDFKDFFDYEKAINEIDKPKSNLNDRERHLACIAARVNR